MNKVTYTGNDLASEVPTMQKPTPPEVKNNDYFLAYGPIRIYERDLEAYEQHLASLQTILVLPGHNWIIGQTYEEGRDYVRQEQVYLHTAKGWVNKPSLGNPYGRDERTVLQPIVKQPIQTEDSYVWHTDENTKDLVIGDNEKDEKWSKELDTSVEDDAPVSISTTEFIIKAKSLLKKIYDGYGKYHKKKFDDNEESTCSTCGGFLYVERGGVGDVDCPSCNGTGQDSSCIFDSEGFSEFIEHTIMFGGEPFLELLEYNVKAGDAVNDVASTSKASPSLASHSCTDGNSMRHPIRVKNLSMSRQIWINIYYNTIHNNEVVADTLMMPEEDAQADFFHSVETNKMKSKKYAIDLAVQLLREGIKIHFLDGSKSTDVIKSVSPPLWERFYSQQRTEPRK